MTNPASAGARGGEPAAAATAEAGRCTVCGVYTELAIGDQIICESCLAARGSCCTEWDDDDSGRD